jgi:hypothetical protein
LLFDPEPEIRLKSEQIIFKYFNTLPDSVKQCETIRTWTIANDFIFSPENSPLKRDVDLVSTLGLSIGEEYPLGSLRYHLDYRTSVTTDLRGIAERSIDRFIKIPPADLQQLFKTEFSPLLKVILKIAESYWDRLSPEQKEVIPIDELLASEDYVIQATAIFLVLEHYEELAHIAKKKPPIEALRNLQGTLDITFEPGESFISKLESISIDKWSEIQPDVLRMLITMPILTEALIPKLLENYDDLSQEQRTVFVTLKSSPRVANVLGRYINNHKYTFKNLSDGALIDLLSFPGYIQHIVLSGLLIRFEQLSKEAKRVINVLIENPPDWVGGAIGLLTSKRRFEIENTLSEDVRDLPIKLSRHHNKRVVGALLAEMASLKCDEFHGLQEMYEPTLYELSRDPEAVRYADAWMDYELEVLEFNDKEFWSKVKAHLRILSERDSQ